MKLLDLSIGEPRGPALLSAREAAATAIMSDKEEMHQYQYNASPGVPGFAKIFVEFCTGGNIDSDAVAFLPRDLADAVGHIVHQIKPSDLLLFKQVDRVGLGLPVHRDEDIAGLGVAIALGKLISVWYTPVRHASRAPDPSLCASRRIDSFATRLAGLAPCSFQ